MEFNDVMYWSYKLVGMVYLILATLCVFFGVTKDDSIIRYLGVVCFIVAIYCSVEEIRYELRE